MSDSMPSSLWSFQHRPNMLIRLPEAPRPQPAQTFSLMLCSCKLCVLQAVQHAQHALQAAEASEQQQGSRVAPIIALIALLLSAR